MKEKLVVKINNELSIFADKRTYIVKVCENTKPDYWYFPTLDMCFQEIFDHLCKMRLSDGKDKEMKEIAETILKTRKEILEIMKPFVDIKSKV